MKRYVDFCFSKAVLFEDEWGTEFDFFSLRSWHLMPDSLPNRRYHSKQTSANDFELDL